MPIRDPRPWLQRPSRGLGTVILLLILATMPFFLWYGFTLLFQHIPAFVHVNAGPR